MKKYLAGGFNISKDILFFTDNFEEFFDENNNKADDKNLENWAVLVNSPWSQAHEGFKIKCNCKNAYEPMKDDEPTWKCEYYITGYDGLTAFVIGYGFSEIEALKECKKHFDFLQKKHNPQMESI